jgi:hypothetical protein
MHEQKLKTSIRINFQKWLLVVKQKQNAWMDIPMSTEEYNIYYLGKHSQL